MPELTDRRTPEGYTDAEWEGKRCFHLQARRKLLAVARALGLGEDDYDLRTNLAGPAVLGETTLHTDQMYLQTREHMSGFGGEITLLYRTCKGRRDCSGGHNNFMLFKMLDSPRSAAETIRRALGIE